MRVGGGGAPVNRDGVPVEGDASGAGDGLGCAFNDLVAGGGAVANDEQLGVVEVEFAPAQPGGFTPAQSS